MKGYDPSQPSRKGREYDVLEGYVFIVVDCGHSSPRRGKGSSFLFYSRIYLPSIISVITSLMSSPAARICWGMKLVAVMPGVVFISRRFIFSPSVMM